MQLQIAVTHCNTLAGWYTKTFVEGISQELQYSLPVRPLLLVIGEFEQTKRQIELK